MIWLAGSRGMLGTDVEALLRESGVPFLASDQEVDITREDAAGSFLTSRKVRALDWIINCAAYTAVDAAEDEQDRAFAVNETGVRNLARAARTTGASLLHISTDYVFDGSKNGAYTEDDPPNPIGAYGRSKLAGEIALQNTLFRHVIVRTAWLYGRNGNNFVSTMLRLFRDRDTVSVVDDQWGSPTYAPDLARAIVSIVGRPQTSFGIYHFSSEGRTTWYQFAAEIYRMAVARGVVRPGLQIVPVNSAQYPTRAQRPRNSLLAKDKIRNTFGIAIRDWHDALEDFFDKGAS